MDNKNDNIYDEYSNSTILNNREEQKNNYDRNNCYQEYEDIKKNNDELLKENLEDYYRDYLMEQNNIKEEGDRHVR